MRNLKDDDLLTNDQWMTSFILTMRNLKKKQLLVAIITEFVLY